jgi:hypothetical protein
MSEQRKILELLAGGQLSVEQADELLNALGSELPKPKGAAKMVRIEIDAADEAKIRVNVPAPLAKFAMGFIPKETRDELTAQGINLGEILDVLKGELPEGRLVEIEAQDDGKPVRILIEVV